MGPKAVSTGFHKLGAVLWTPSSRALVTKTPTRPTERAPPVDHRKSRVCFLAEGLELGCLKQGVFMALHLHIRYVAPEVLIDRAHGATRCASKTQNPAAQEDFGNDHALCLSWRNRLIAIHVAPHGQELSIGLFIRPQYEANTCTPLPSKLGKSLLSKVSVVRGWGSSSP